MIGNSGGLALTIGIAGALVGGDFSPLPTLWPALSFCTGLLVSAAQPIIGTWRLLRFRGILETMTNPAADLTQLEDDAKDELKDRLGNDVLESDVGFQVIPRLPSFLPIIASSIFFILGLIGGMIGLYYLQGAEAMTKALALP